MIVMLMLIVAAIVAMQLMPDEQTLVSREKEEFYNSDLSQLREAIDLVRFAARDPNSPAYNLEDPKQGWQEFLASDTAASISAKIASLTAWGFLRKSDLRDNSIPKFAWGLDSNNNQIYWIVTTNYASNTSFEHNDEGLNLAEFVSDNWRKDPVASAATVDNIKINSMAVDEYPYQNKLGDSTRDKNAIKMIRIDR